MLTFTSIFAVLIFRQYRCHLPPVPSASKGRRIGLYLPYLIFPLRVLKQIACMLFSINSDTLKRLHPEIVRFVLNRTERHWPSEARALAGYTLASRARLKGR
jgi:hypothetical protein